MSSFTHAGVSTLNGKIKVRYANGSSRVKVLIKNGHTRIDMIEMIYPMSKKDAIAYLLRIDFDNGNAEIRGVLEAEAKKRGVDVPSKQVEEVVEDVEGILDIEVKDETDAALEAAA